MPGRPDPSGPATSSRQCEPGSPGGPVGASPGGRADANAEAALELRARIRAQVKETGGVGVLTGGQTGADTAAAIAALRLRLPVHLVFPRGLLQEDGPISVSRLRRLRGARIHELGSAKFRDRTWTCANIADAVILIDPAGGDGCRETVLAARGLGRPLLDLSDLVQAGAEGGSEGPEDQHSTARGEAGHGYGDRQRVIGGWLERIRPRVLMIAGCRGSLLAAAGQDDAVARLADEISGVAARLEAG